MDDTNTIELMKVTEVADMLRMSRSGVWAKVKAGDLPPPLKFGRLSRWKRDEIETVIAEANARRKSA